MEKLDNKHSCIPGLKAGLVHLRRKRCSAVRNIPFQRMTEIRQLFSYKGLWLCASYLKNGAVTPSKATRLVSGTGSDSKAKLHELVTAAIKYLSD